MVGSRADAEDMVQETFIRRQQAFSVPIHNHDKPGPLPRFQRSKRIT
ncbi:MAG: hypothetical protein JO108_36875 [Acidobacteriaceae bacterium]|nr:hypothetical protein [Acidobacteriaceae bacterium]